ncbi:MAG TPA: radical SAM family heme chaperone HemW [Blastocatellia bacterium]|nr:radical SAM family heme chaperone HemW [Blastocatellia bacterium]
MMWGIYIHIPFCHYKCIYCDFDSGVYSPSLIADYLAALQQEILRAGEDDALSGLVADTIYFGGGTPSVLRGEDIEEILDTVRRCFALREPMEITLEANPGTLTREKVRRYASAGVNRVSVGAQSFHDEELKMLGRIHTVEEVHRSVDVLRDAGIENINLDVIAGLPHQTMDRWQRTMDALFALHPPHVSMYLLDVHEETALATLIRKNVLPPPDEDLMAAFYYAFVDRATAEGYEHYEISNFCRPGHQSRHNLKYWSDQPYLGFGCSAHSYDLTRRWWNIPTPTAYIGAMRTQGIARAGVIPLTPEERAREALFLGLRRREGINLSDFSQRYGVDVLTRYGPDLESLREHGLIEWEGGQLKLTRKGLILANEVFTVFV